MENISNEELLELCNMLEDFLDNLNNLKEE